MQDTILAGHSTDPMSIVLSLDFDTLTFEGHVCLVHDDDCKVVLTRTPVRLETNLIDARTLLLRLLRMLNEHVRPQRRPLEDGNDGSRFRQCIVFHPRDTIGRRFLFCRDQVVDEKSHRSTLDGFAALRNEGGKRHNVVVASLLEARVAELDFQRRGFSFIVFSFLSHADILRSLGIFAVIFGCVDCQRTAYNTR